MIELEKEDLDGAYWRDGKCVYNVGVKEPKFEEYFKCRGVYEE
jgi:hypothetical protein